MTCTPVKLYVFASSDLADDFRAAQRLTEALGARRHVVRLVDRMSAELPDLELVARYGVVEPSALIAVVGGEVRARVCRAVQVEQIEQMLAEVG